MNHQLNIADLTCIDAVAEEFLKLVGDRRLLAFYAPMGAGKTTFTSALCRALGVEDSVCSPTFTIINEYATKSGEILYHFDFYRIKNNAEAIDLGLDDYFYSGCRCIMEWPENVEDLLPEDCLKVRITVNPDESRTLEW